MKDKNQIIIEILDSLEFKESESMIYSNPEYIDYDFSIWYLTTRLLKEYAVIVGIIAASHIILKILRDLKNENTEKKTKKRNK